ncbi:hypothetical protein ACHAWX_000958 [Stephanocyclus meneghinianus]
MRHQEQNAYKCSDYMDSAKATVHPSDRQALCNWGYQIISACIGVDRSSAVVAILYFDRFLSTSSPTVRWALADKCKFQLVFVACLVIALKVHSVFNIELDFVSDVLCGGAYSVEEIIVMEGEVLKALEWRLNGPTPHDFIDRFLHFLPPIDSIHIEYLSCFSKSLAEQALTRFSMALKSPSIIAFASIFCSLQCMDSLSNLTNLSILHIIDAVPGLDISDPQLRAICRKMIRLMREFSSSAHESVVRM